MKNIILTACILSFFLISCENDKALEDAVPSCIQENIEASQKNSPQGASITQYIYNGENVFAFDPGTVIPDWLYTVVNDKCEVVCEFGGIAGLNTCPDFSENAELVGIFWEDQR